MTKCEVCSMYEYFRILKNLRMCVRCYRANMNETSSPGGTNVKHKPHIVNNPDAF